MWSSVITEIANGRILKIDVVCNSSAVSYADTIKQWQTNVEFRKFFIGLLVQPPFATFRWETPPVTNETANQPFQFVLLNSPELDCEPDPSAFSEYFANSLPGEVVCFPNLGNDAQLVAPCPASPLQDYGHLAAFLRYADESLQHALWQSVGVAMQRRLGSKPVWLSTAGGGVPWLHVRLDDRPKYYGYTPYRDAKTIL